MTETPNSPTNDLKYAELDQSVDKFLQGFEPFYPYEISQRAPRMEYLSQKSTSTVASTLSTPDSSVEYLAELLKEKKQLDLFPQAFRNIERIVNEEISRVRMSLFKCNFSFDNLDLPEREGEYILVQDKVFVPRKEHPDFNFVGRILGPRGMTAKQLEEETGCKIMIRGRGSMRDSRKEEMNRGKPNWEHLDEDLHILVQCEDTLNRAYTKLKAAVNEIKKLLVPTPEGADELKRKQLMELAIINGTYRPINKYACARLFTPVTPVTLLSPLRPPNGAIGPQQFFVSPVSSPITAGTNLNSSSAVNAYLQSPNVDYNLMINQLLLDTGVTAVPMEYHPQGSSMIRAGPIVTNSFPNVFQQLQSYFSDSVAGTPLESTAEDYR